MEKDSKPINILSYNSLNCNTWNLSNFENISYAPLGCPNCESNLGFSFLYSKIRQGIDVVAPTDIYIPKFSDFKLVTVDILYPIVMCSCCKKIFIVVPAFVTTGTTLTLAAQVLIAVIYHATLNVTWRRLHLGLCRMNNGIAHTTLYRAYHSFGKNLVHMKDSITSIIEENTLCDLNNEIPRKAEKFHTKKFETVIINFLLILWLSLAEDLKIFWKNHWKLLEVLSAKECYTENFQNTQISIEKINTS